MDVWQLPAGRANILMTLCDGRSKKHRDCVLSRMPTADEVRAFPAWYYRKRGGGMSRDVALPVSPPVFQQHWESYFNHLARQEQRRRDFQPMMTEEELNAATFDVLNFRYYNEELGRWCMANEVLPPELRDAYEDEAA